MEFINIFKVQRTQFEIKKGFQPSSSLFYLLKGRFRIVLNGQQQTVQAGDLIYLPKTLYFEREVLEPLEFIYIRFQQDEEFAHLAGLLNIPNRSYFEDTLQYLWPTKNINKDDIQPIRNHFLRSIFYMCMWQYCTPVCADRGILTCIHYLNEHYAENISLEMLCDISAYSRTTLIQRFKQHLGKTPFQYLNELRIRQAKIILTATSLPISTVAEQCGFRCPYYFSNTFQKHCGESPRSYRKRHMI